MTERVLNWPALKRQNDEMVEAGLLDADQPTPFSHYRHMAEVKSKLMAEFTADERAQIRLALGLVVLEEAEA